MIDYENLLEDFKDYLIGLILLLYLPAIDDLEKLNNGINEKELIELTKSYDFEIKEYIIGDIDYELLRSDLIKYYPKRERIFNFSFFDDIDINTCSNSKLLEYAREQGLDFSKYEKGKVLVKK